MIIYFGRSFYFVSNRFDNLFEGVKSAICERLSSQKSFVMNIFTKLRVSGSISGLG